MSENEDQRAIRELSRIAQVYLTRGDLDKAEEVLTLVEAIQSRMQREQTNQQERAG